MDIRQLRYFISVAEHLNFTEAAKQLFVAQPAVSQQIANLEKQMGVQLFIRDKHSVRLTNAGTVFLKDAQDIFSRFEESIERARQAEHGLIGKLNIGLLSAPVRKLLPHLVRQFRQKYPNIHIHFNFYHLAELLEKLKADEIDLAFTLSLGLHSIGGLEIRSLCTQPHCIIMHQDHPMANRKSINVAELAQEPFVMLERQESPPGFDLVMAMCANHGFSPSIVSQTSRVETVLMIVDSGIGITIMPRHLQLYNSPTLRFINIEGDDHKVDVVASWKKMNTNPTISLIIEEMETLLSQPHDFFSFMSSSSDTDER
ncbi:LysR family transcriptional regulator [Ferviditalea candida]|uniref:LysR family transcriptional regulator n=1 Tax=Ferviditalea candida TaxID=3108399 RepID=A0ABU5ZC42_9BACL|nr:LysR family transcriptional regulator [Paenibacillaceae bacterium T2]